MTKATRLTYLEVSDLVRGLPDLIRVLQERKETRRALDVGMVVQRLRPAIETFELTRQGLLAAYGEGNPPRVKAETKEWRLYIEAMEELNTTETPLNIPGTFAVYPEEISELAPLALMQIAGYVTEADDAPGTGTEV